MPRADLQTRVQNQQLRDELRRRGAVILNLMNAAGLPATEAVLLASEMALATLTLQRILSRVDAGRWE